MRTTMMVAAALVGGLVLGLAVSGHAQEEVEPARYLGTVRARTYTHSYKMPLDVGVDLDYKAADRIDEERQLVLFPDIYGELIHVTPHGDAVVMWFRDEEGIVRNAVLDDVSTSLVSLQRAPARHIGRPQRDHILAGRHMTLDGPVQRLAL